MLVYEFVNKHFFELISNQFSYRIIMERQASEYFLFIFILQLFDNQSLNAQNIVSQDVTVGTPITEIQNSITFYRT